MTTPPMQRRPSDPVQPAVERVPWSVLGPEFIREWGRPRGENEPEHLEILGPTGSGKSMLKRDLLLERARRRGTHVVTIVTKEADKTMSSLGWPVTDTWKGVQKNPQVIFWPRTDKLGEERHIYQETRIKALLQSLWRPNANSIVDFDEWVYIERLSPDLKALLNTYAREGRSHGLTVVMGKQRVQGTQRDMHSESDWKFAFKMNDQDDNERLAQLYGSKREWVPVICDLDRERYEFLVQHKLTGDSYISWVDKPVPAARPESQRNSYAAH